MKAIVRMNWLDPVKASFMHCNVGVYDDSYLVTVYDLHTGKAFYHRIGKWWGLLGVKEHVGFLNGKYCNIHISKS